MPVSPKIIKKHEEMFYPTVRVRAKGSGGSGTVVAEILAGHGNFNLRRLGLDNTFGESGTPEELTRKYGLDALSVRATVRDLLSKT